MLLILIRAVFVLVIAGFGARLARIVGENDLGNPYLIFIGVMIGAVLVVGRRPADAPKANPDDLGPLLSASSSEFSSPT